MAYKKGDILKEWYWIVAFVAMLIALRIFAQQMTIDLASGMISKSYFGLFKKEMKIADIKGFEILKHVYVVFHNGTDIIVNSTAGKPVKVFERIGKTKNVETILHEIKQIIASK